MMDFEKCEEEGSETFFVFEGDNTYGWLMIHDNIYRYRPYASSNDPKFLITLTCDQLKKIANKLDELNK